MSDYTNINGFIIYKDKSNLESALTILTHGFWMDNECYWLDECGQRINDHPSVSLGSEFKLTFESCIYKNLDRWIDDLLIGSTESHIRLYCTDGNYWFQSIENGITNDSQKSFLESIKDLEQSLSHSPS